MKNRQLAAEWVKTYALMMAGVGNYDAALLQEYRRLQIGTSPEDDRLAEAEDRMLSEFRRTQGSVVRVRKVGGEMSDVNISV